MFCVLCYSFSYIAQPDHASETYMFEGNKLCYQASSDCLTAMSGLSKNRGLRGTSWPNMSLDSMPSCLVNSHWMKQIRVD